MYSQPQDNSAVPQPSQVKLAVIGTGYVGLVSGACLSELGTTTVCVDVDQKRIDALNNLQMPFYEPGLEALVRNNAQAQRLSFTIDIKEALQSSNVAMICVGTPAHPITGEADLQYVKSAARNIAMAITTYTVVVIKSTVPVGTTEMVAQLILETNKDLKRGVHFDVADNPEFLREGSAIKDFFEPDRIVLGVDSDQAMVLLKSLYSSFVLQGRPLIFVDIESSELSKYASNAFLALKISFANQLADLCEKCGARIEDVTSIMGLDARIGPAFLKVGPGYGGSCFPKDTSALVEIAKHYNVSAGLTAETIVYNDERKKQLSLRIQKIVSSYEVENPHIAVLGITFKANTDDLRDSASYDIISALKERGYQITVYDPMYNATTSYKKPDWDVNWAPSLDDALKNKDAAVILTEWEEFKTAGVNKIANGLKRPLVIDFRNMFDDRQVRGVAYHSIGRKPTAFQEQGSPSQIEIIGRPLRTKKVLVTGGAGFLGINLCHALLTRGYGVICLDNYYTGRRQNLKHIQHFKNLQILEHDVTKPLKVDVDEIYNLACPASPPHYQKDPIFTMNCSIDGIRNLLDLAVDCKAKLLHTSTSEVYGDPEISPQSEKYWGNVNPIGIRACYDEGKRAAETYIVEYNKKFKIDARFVRIFNTYGPHMDPKDGRVVSNFIVQALKGEKITIYGEGKQTRSFCYVDDLIEGLITTMETTNEVRGPVNLGNPNELEVVSFAKLVIRLTGSKSEFSYLPLPQDDPMQRRPDITLAGKLLGWKPKVSLEEGVQKTLEYFRSIIDQC